MRIMSWNINGLRALLRRHNSDYGALMTQLGEPNVLSLQETRMSLAALAGLTALAPPGYEAYYACCASRGGYSGVATLARAGSVLAAFDSFAKAAAAWTPDDVLDAAMTPHPLMPTGWAGEGLQAEVDRQAAPAGSDASSPAPESVDGDDRVPAPPTTLRQWLDSWAPRFDAEGRMVFTRHGLVGSDKDILLCNGYFPNVGQGGERVAFKHAFNALIAALATAWASAGFHVVILGDFNVVHRDIDCFHANPPAHEAGLNPAERAWMESLVGSGGAFLDAFRIFHPTESRKYTWWSVKKSRRPSNNGWRLDYFALSPSLLAEELVADSDILPDVHGSDHCPITLTLSAPCRLRAPDEHAPAKLPSLSLLRSTSTASIATILDSNQPTIVSMFKRRRPRDDDDAGPSGASPTKRAKGLGGLS